MKKGADLIRDKHANRSLAFTREEREQLGLRGLLPWPVVDTPHLVERVMMELRRLPTDLDRYVLLSGLQERNERLYYRTILDHIEELLPVIYTPTVGEACKQFSHIAREPGMLEALRDSDSPGNLIGILAESDRLVSAH